MRDRGWRTRDFIELSRAELGMFFHGHLGPEWQRLVARRLGHSAAAIRRIWPTDERFKSVPLAPFSAVFQSVEDLARSYGYRSTLENPARVAANKLARYRRALGFPNPKQVT